ncbi:EAL domain-containing protein [Azospirillum sp. A29]|jgi:predicted signal transduction protein with EAL and GGDEF domain|uniref:EAL domain-containing protein n=1 Tax=Azospirillum sp. A29 TaxID=3160606 RepID=UPI00366DD858
MPDASVPRAIVGLGRSLGLSVIAEGVETQEQLPLLRDPACESYQGFLFSRPLPAAEVERLERLSTAAGAKKALLERFKAQPMAAVKTTREARYAACKARSR